MPNIKSAIKRVKVSEKRRLNNASQKSELRTAVKAFENTLSSDNAKSAHETFNYASKKLSMAASKGIIHKNAASRKQSRLAKKLNVLAEN